MDGQATFGGFQNNPHTAMVRRQQASTDRRIIFAVLFAMLFLVVLTSVGIAVGAYFLS